VQRLPCNTFPSFFLGSDQKPEVLCVCLSHPYVLPSVHSWRKQPCSLTQGKVLGRA